jgi:hypothetical protein
MKEDLEKLILNSYEIIRENDNNLIYASPKERLRLQSETDAQWKYIGMSLAQYTDLCERLNVQAPEEIIEIAAARFSDLTDRLKVAGTSKSRPPEPSPPSPPPDFLQKDPHSPFRINYHFACPFMPKDSDELAQFVVAFSSRGDVDFSQVNVRTHICLVLDVSGSMDVPNKYPYLLQAIPHVLGALSADDWLSIVLFSSRSELVWSKDVASSRGREQEIVQRIDQSGVKFGRTYLAPGLSIATREIEHFFESHPEAITRLYVLTDGQLHDADECYQLNPDLQNLEIEVNSYGFGQDFAEETMREIMKGCPGGRVQWISDAEDLSWRLFHTGEMSRNVVATKAEFEVDFSSSVTPGDVFRFDPGMHWFGSIDRNGQFHTRIGALEKSRAYIYAFEARVHPAEKEREKVATAVLKYRFQGEPRQLKQDIFVTRTGEQWRYEEAKDERIEYLFLALDDLRNKDPQSRQRSFEARLKILRSEDGDPDLIEALESALAKLKAGKSLTERELRILRTDTATKKIARDL